MVVAVAAGTLADRELVLEDPREVARCDPEGPLASKARWHQRPSTSSSAIAAAGPVTGADATRAATPRLDFRLDVVHPRRPDFQALLRAFDPDAAGDLARDVLPARHREHSFDVRQRWWVAGEVRR